MKTIIQSVILAIAFALIAPTQAIAIEGLKISIHCPDVWLSWPSVENGETYIVQYRQTLDSESSWITLTNAMPPDPGTNWTTFVHSNQVQCPPGQIFGMSSGGGGSALSLGESDALAPLPVRPLSSYPEGLVDAVLAGQTNYFQQFHLSVPVRTNGTFVFLPWEKVHGRPLGVLVRISETMREKVLASLSEDASESSLVSDGLEQPNDPEPMDGGGSDPTTGFYRVVRNGVWFFGLTNGTLLTGSVSLPIEAGNDQGALESVTISANDAPIEGTSMLSQPLPPQLWFAVDTRRLVNGDYYLQAVGMWTLPAADDFDPGHVRLYSPAVLVTVSNQISFPDWVQDYRDDLMLIKASSAQTNVDWRIDIYGQTGSYVGSFTNHSDDGQINISWNLQGAGGIAQTDNVFTTVTTISSPGAPSFTATNPPLIKVVDNYPDQGMWMVARASYIPASTQNYGLYTNAIDYFAVMGEAGGGVLPGQPYRNPGHALFLSKATAYTNWSQMYGVFLNHHEVRNFYFDGHGGPDWIGYAWNTNGVRDRDFPASLVAQALGNDVPSTNSTRFRWVWLDSCSTALGMWPQAFGLGNREDVALTNYVSRPGAFCGWDQDTYAWTPSAHEVDTRSISFRYWFVYYWWFEDASLRGAFDAAEYDSQFSAEHLKIYGYWGLGWEEYNTKTEWPP